MSYTARILFPAILAAAVVQAAEVRAFELRYGTDSPVSQRQQEALESAAVRFLESSNFNSRAHASILKTTPSQVHAAYRKTIAGRYLVVSFETPRRIRTVGGEIDVVDIVVGLNRPDYPDALLTIDAEGRVLSHGKYSGGVGVQLMDEIRKVRPGA